MSGHTIDADVDLFRKKESTMVFSGQPSHGSPAWRKSGGDWVGLIYWNKSPHRAGWLTAEEFRRRKNEIKLANINFYNANPHLLRKKIDNERRGSRLFRSVSLLPPSWECSGSAFPFGNGD